VSEQPLLLNISVQDGKYTFVQHGSGRFECLRYGESWWEPTEGSNAVLALAYALEEAQAIARRLAGALSTTHGYTDRHPQDVLDEFTREVKS